ncbi:gamma-glutamyltransferase family protein [Cystobacter fuscus]|uniref:gamma-glutamyltransferase family protein n=1 Tax=Cystobacter fuscus TaxID=43 RepID=UPI002B291779|nr:gamma-glutamyltransferase family protein [Cystobacter fuscus]
MRRRTFLAALPVGLSAVAQATSEQPRPTPPTAPIRTTDDAPAPAPSRADAGAVNPNLKRPDVRSGDRIAGASYASRSAAWGMNGAAATAHPLATLAALDILRAGGSAVDAAIAANAVLGFVEPVSCGIGGDCFAMLWDPKARKVVGLNGSGRSPRGLSLEEVRRRAVKGYVPRVGMTSVSVPGAVDAWWSLHQRYGRLKWAELFQPAIAHAQAGVPQVQTIGYYLGRNLARFLKPDSGVEETANAERVYGPGAAAAEGDVWRNPDLARTYQLIARGGRDAFYAGPIAQAIERYFRRIGGWMTRADLSAHHSEWTEPLSTDYRGVDVYGLAPNSQGLSTLQMLGILRHFDLRGMGFQSAQSIHHQVEAKRLAFEDRARYFADPTFFRAPLEQLNSPAYAAERAKLIRADRLLERVMPMDAPSRGDTTYLCTSDKNGMMVSLIQSNFRGMGSGLVSDGTGAGHPTLGFMFQDRGELFSLTDGHPNLYAPGKRPFQTIIPGFAVRGGEPWLAFGVMGGDMQPQGQAQIIINMVDYGLDLQAAGDSPRWHHEGSSEPTGEAQQTPGLLRLETGVPEATKKALVALGWKLGEPDGGFGGYQCIERRPGRYGAATEMRKDGVALAY